jgi:hypothetical protein
MNLRVRTILTPEKKKKIIIVKRMKKSEEDSKFNKYLTDNQTAKK